MHTGAFFVSNSLSVFSRSLCITAGIFTLSACTAAPPKTSAREQQALVEQATFAVQTNFMGPNVAPHALALLAKSKALIICPDISSISLVIGGSGGRCVLLSRDARHSWSDPAFYHLDTGSFGLQAGYQHSQLFLFITSQRGIQAMLDHQVTFDAKAAAAFGKHTRNSQSSYGNDNPNGIYAVQRTNGLFAGVALGGSKLTPVSSANRAYYKQIVGPEDIVINMRVNNTAADPLRRALMRASKQ